MQNIPPICIRYLYDNIAAYRINVYGITVSRETETNTAWGVMYFFWYFLRCTEAVKDKIFLNINTRYQHDIGTDR